MNLHRTPDGSRKGLKTCSYQCNRTTGIKSIAKKGRKEALNDVKKYLHEINEDEEIIITGDFNQAI